MSKVSIVVPVYNVEQYLEQCLCSIQNQSFSDIEVIAIDNGGKDGCPLMLQRFAQDDKRIKVITLEQNIGLRGAWLLGLSYVTSDYVTFVDSDDFILDDFVEQLVEAITKHDVDCASAGYRDYVGEQYTKKMFDKEKIYDKQSIESEILTPFFEQTESIDKTFGNSRWGKIYKTKLLQQVAKNCDLNVSSGEDIELNIRFLSACSSVKTIPNCDGYCYRSIREGAISHKFDKVRLERDDHFYRVIDEIALEQKRPAKALGTEVIFNSANRLKRYLNENTDISEKLFCANKVIARVYETNKITNAQKDRLTAMLIYPCIVGELPKKEKIKIIRQLKSKLNDKNYLFEFAKNESFKGKISYYAVALGLESLIINLAQ